MNNDQVLNLMELAAANQVVAEEKRRNREVSIADFEGVVQGRWMKLQEDGSGVVEYKSKQYVIIPRGNKSIPAGYKVNLEYSKGYYIATW